MYDKVILAVLAVTAIAQPSIAYAQESEDVLVMRRIITPPAPETSGNDETEEQDDVGEDVGNDPVYSWNQGSWGGWSETCSLEAVRNRVVTCQDQDGNVADDALCAGNRPNESETGENFSGCNAEWALGEWSDWSTTCGDAIRDRSVACVTFDIEEAGYPLSEDYCLQVEEEPQSTESSFIRSTCDPIYNGTFNQNLNGWLTRRALASGGNALLEGGSHPNTAYLIQDVHIENGVTYDFSINYSGNTSGCSESRAVPVALYRRPNGAEQPIEGTFFIIPFQFCNYETGSRTASFTANYTGVASLVIWVEAKAGQSYSAYIHDVSLLPR